MFPPPILEFRFWLDKGTIPPDDGWDVLRVGIIDDEEEALDVYDDTDESGGCGLGMGVVGGDKSLHSDDRLFIPA